MLRKKVCPLLIDPGIRRHLPNKSPLPVYLSFCNIRCDCLIASFIKNPFRGINQFRCFSVNTTPTVASIYHYGLRIIGAINFFRRLSTSFSGSSR